MFASFMWSAANFYFLYAQPDTAISRKAFWIIIDLTPILATLAILSV